MENIIKFVLVIVYTIHISTTSSLSHEWQFTSGTVKD